ncbi:hypothetical protein DFP72DRAFT_855545 [Ephemerocybe angulata]|uniref:Uncharacterized protein n=1 Tax=Ephemerocybe angulata TaxID=980116 RepID=A0A8H6LXE2_9AGAR|nr:hypothetical protein DFP72DRAFT_855545 [Tulosesus angulatus]
MANTTCSGTSSKADIRTSACILSLANETLYLIADILAREPIDLTSFMLSCKPLAAIAENVRYSGLMISGVPGRRLMSTLLSGTTAATRYCITVKRVWFRGSGGCDMHLMSSLLAEMLPRLGGLTALWLEASPLDAIQLMERMRKNGMIRERIHPAFFIRDVASSGPCTPLKNPCLKFVRLSGDPVMAGIIAHRRLEELDMSHLMDHDEFAHFISNAEHSNLGDALKSLTIKLGRIIKIELALPLIATAFPELVSLTIEQTQLSVKVQSNELPSRRALTDRNHPARTRWTILQPRLQFSPSSKISY